jgi:hypothetical protein
VKPGTRSLEMVCGKVGSDCSAVKNIRRSWELDASIDDGEVEQRLDVK